MSHRFVGRLGIYGRKVKGHVVLPHHTPTDVHWVRLHAFEREGGEEESKVGRWSWRREGEWFVCASATNKWLCVNGSKSSPER